MPRQPMDEVKICDSWKRSFRAGGFSLAPRPPPHGLVTRPRPIFARVQGGASDRELRVFRGLFRNKNTHKLPASKLDTV